MAKGNGNGGTVSGGAAITEMTDEQLKAARELLNKEYKLRQEQNSAKGLEGKTVRILQDPRIKKQIDGSTEVQEGKFAGMVGQVMIARRSRVFVKTALGMAYVLAADVEVVEGSAAKTDRPRSERPRHKA